jgi:hypothetical protein
MQGQADHRVAKSKGPFRQAVAGGRAKMHSHLSTEPAAPSEATHWLLMLRA